MTLIKRPCSSGISLLSIGGFYGKPDKQESGGIGEPFLGTATCQFSGGPNVTFRTRSKTGGVAKVSWSRKIEDAKFASYLLEHDDWKETTVTLFPDGKHGIIRLFLPAAAMPVGIDWIEIASEGIPTLPTQNCEVFRTDPTAPGNSGTS